MSLSTHASYCVECDGEVSVLSPREIVGLRREIREDSRRAIEAAVRRRPKAGPGSRREEAAPWREESRF